MGKKKITVEFGDLFYDGAAQKPPEVRVEPEPKPAKREWDRYTMELPPVDARWDKDTMVLPPIGADPFGPSLTGVKVEVEPVPAQESVQKIESKIVKEGERSLVYGVKKDGTPVPLNDTWTNFILDNAGDKRLTESVMNTFGLDEQEAMGVIGLVVEQDSRKQINEIAAKEVFEPEEDTEPRADTLELTEGFQSFVEPGDMVGDEAPVVMETAAQAEAPDIAVDDETVIEDEPLPAGEVPQEKTGKGKIFIISTGGEDTIQLTAEELMQVKKKGVFGSVIMEDKLKQLKGIANFEATLALMDINKRNLFEEAERAIGEGQAQEHEEELPEAIPEGKEVIFTITGTDKQVKLKPRAYETMVLDLRDKPDNLSVGQNYLITNHNLDKNEALDVMQQIKARVFSETPVYEQEIDPSLKDSGEFGPLDRVPPTATAVPVVKPAYKDVSTQPEVPAAETEKTSTLELPEIPESDFEAVHQEAYADEGAKTIVDVRAPEKPVEIEVEHDSAGWHAVIDGQKIFITNQKMDRWLKLDKQGLNGALKLDSEFKMKLEGIGLNHEKHVDVLYEIVYQARGIDAEETLPPVPEKASAELGIRIHDIAGWNPILIKENKLSLLVGALKKRDMIEAERLMEELNLNACKKMISKEDKIKIEQVTDESAKRRYSHVFEKDSIRAMVSIIQRDHLEMKENLLGNIPEEGKLYKILIIHNAGNWNNYELSGNGYDDVMAAVAEKDFDSAVNVIRKDMIEWLRQKEKIGEEVPDEDVMKIDETHFDRKNIMELVAIANKYYKENRELFAEENIGIETDPNPTIARISAPKVAPTPGDMIDEVIGPEVPAADEFDLQFWEPDAKPKAPAVPKPWKTSKGMVRGIERTSAEVWTIQVEQNHTIGIDYRDANKIMKALGKGDAKKIEKMKRYLMNNSKTLDQNKTNKLIEKVKQELARQERLMAVPLEKNMKLKLRDPGITPRYEMHFTNGMYPIDEKVVKKVERAIEKHGYEWARQVLQKEWLSYDNKPHDLTDDLATECLKLIERDYIKPKRISTIKWAAGIAVAAGLFGYLGVKAIVEKAEQPVKEPPKIVRKVKVVKPHLKVKPAVKKEVIDVMTVAVQVKNLRYKDKQFDCYEITIGKNLPIHTTGKPRTTKAIMKGLKEDEQLSGLSTEDLKILAGRIALEVKKVEKRLSESQTEEQKRERAMMKELKVHYDKDSKEYQFLVEGAMVSVPGANKTRIMNLLKKYVADAELRTKITAKVARMIREMQEKKRKPGRKTRVKGYRGGKKHRPKKPEQQRRRRRHYRDLPGTGINPLEFGSISSGDYSRVKLAMSRKVHGNSLEKKVKRIITKRKA